MKTIQELHILVGLPGSGKSTFAHKLVSENYGLGFIADFDKIKKGLKPKYSMSDQMAYVERSAIPYSFNGKILIADGLFLTQKDVEWVINMYCNSSYFKARYSVKLWVIDYWVPDIDSCLWNDIGRRTVDSESTIKNAIVEKPDIELIKKDCSVSNIVLHTHSVIRKPQSIVDALEHGVDISDIVDDMYIESDSWSLGGEGRTWMGETYYIDAEKPCDFEKFDGLLEEICPSITFLHYKKLFSNCVEVCERDNSDYYSSCKEAYYRCDLTKLFDMLREMGYLE